MRRLTLSLLLCVVSAAQATQSIDPAVFRGLNAAQSAQQQGDHAAARRTLDGLKPRQGSVEQALVWRSQAYLAWAEGRHAAAIDWLDKALHSGHLDQAMAAEERLNLARLNLAERRYAAVVKLLAGQQASAGEEVLQILVQAYQGLAQPAKALPLAERYVQANPGAADSWLQFLAAVNADLKRYAAAEAWQRRLLARQADQPRTWRQLAALQQLEGRHDKALATLRAAQAKGLSFSETELDNLVLLASGAGQPWQGARLLAGLFEQGLLARTPAREERLAQLWWQARERQQAASVFRQLAPRSGSARHWLSLAQLELEQQRWQAGLEALSKAEQAGADRSQVRAWRAWAESELSQPGNRLASRG